MTLGGAAQVAAAYHLNERTLDPAICNYNRPTPCLSQPHYGLHPAMFSGNDSLFSVAVLPDNCYSITNRGGMEDWVGLRTMSVNNLLKFITRKRTWWDSLEHATWVTIVWDLATTPPSITAWAVATGCYISDKCKNKKTMLSLRWPRDAPNIWVPWKFSRVLTSKRYFSRNL